MPTAPTNCFLTIKHYLQVSRSSALDECRLTPWDIRGTLMSFHIWLQRVGVQFTTYGVPNILQPIYGTRPVGRNDICALAAVSPLPSARITCHSLSAYEVNT